MLIRMIRQQELQSESQWKQWNDGSDGSDGSNGSRQMVTGRSLREADLLQRQASLVSQPCDHCLIWTCRMAWTAHLNICELFILRRCWLHFVHSTLVFIDIIDWLHSAGLCDCCCLFSWLWFLWLFAVMLQLLGSFHSVTAPAYYLSYDSFGFLLWCFYYFSLSIPWLLLLLMLHILSAVLPLAFCCYFGFSIPWLLLPTLSAVVPLTFWCDDSVTSVFPFSEYWCCLFSQLWFLWLLLYKWN